MVDITIPGWAIWLIVTFGGGFIGWLILLTKMAFQAREDSRIAAINDNNILGKIDALENKIDENKQDIGKQIEGLKQDIQRLFGAEFSFMKSLIANQSGNRSG